MVAEDGDVGHFLGCHPAPQGWQQGDADEVKHIARGRGHTARAGVLSTSPQAWQGPHAPMVPRPPGPQFLGPS